MRAQSAVAEGHRVHRSDLSTGYAGTFLPNRLGEKYKSAAKELPWQWFFPATKLTRVPDSGEYRRYHLHESVMQKRIKKAVGEAGIPKRATAHTLRHSYASHLLQANYDIRTIRSYGDSLLYPIPHLVTLPIWPASHVSLFPVFPITLRNGATGARPFSLKTGIIGTTSNFCPRPLRSLGLRFGLIA